METAENTGCLLFVHWSSQASVYPKFGMDEAKPVSIPVAVNMKLRVKAEDDESADKKMY